MNARSKSGWMWLAVSLVMVLALILSACAPAATPAPSQPTQAPATTPAPSQPTQAPAQPTPAPQAKDFVTWYQFDQENTDPASDEAVGNAWLRENMAKFNEAFAGKYKWVSTPKAWDKMDAELIAAVQAGGEVPDIVQLTDFNIPMHAKNGSLQDLRAWAEAQPWYAGMDPQALKACMGPDGGLYCIPFAEIPYVVFVWADLFPNDYPKTIDQFLAEAERLKGEGRYIMTYFGSTDKNGSGATRGVWTVISSFGGTYDDGKGHMLLNTPENVAAIEFLRTLTVKGYVPEVTFAGGFQEEEAFKDSSAGSIPTGLFGYRYLRPLTAPDGTKYETQTEQDMLKAIEDGKVVLRPFAAPPGKKPGGGLSVRGVGIPKGAKNREAAEAFINWVLTHADVAADYALRGESGLPVLFAAYDQPQFQGKLYQQAKAVVQASALRPWKGTLERTAEAQMIIMNAVYKLVKEDVTADIPTVLKQAEDEYNAGK